MRDIKFDLDDIVIVAAEESDITSRSDCNVTTEFNGRRVLPLMAAPMDTVVSVENYESFIVNGIIPCIPRGSRIDDKSLNYRYIKKYQHFQSFGLCEIETQLKSDDTDPNYFYKCPNILIDIANGHMSKLTPLITEIKRMFPNITLMVGNVANPETFINLAMAGADYVRISIGTGAGCTTAANVGINYPIGSLIKECYDARALYGDTLNTKIVADGGMRNYSDVIKALALGADYVMIGSIFNKAIESAGFNYLYGLKIPLKTAETLWRWGFPIKKKYRGMSTKAVQRSWGKTNLVTAEGITKYQKVEYTLEQWTENFRDFLKSDMSYSNAKKLDEFIGRVQYVFMTDAARRRFDK